MKSKYAVSAYQTAKRTAPPLVAVVLCYDDVLTRLGNAARAGWKKDYETQHAEVSRASMILTGLCSAVDVETGGDVAVRLQDLYNTLIVTLNRLVAKRDAPEQYRKIAEALIETRNAWAEIANLGPRELEENWDYDGDSTKEPEPPYDGTTDPLAGYRQSPVAK